jgi:hypothetical protein
VRLTSKDDHNKELAILRREVTIKEVEIKIHDGKMKQMKEENAKIRM